MPADAEEIIVNADICAPKHFRENRLELHFNIVARRGSGRVGGQSNWRQRAVVDFAVGV